MIQAFHGFLSTVEPDCDLEGLQSIDTIITELDYALGDFPKMFANNLNIYLGILQNYIGQTTIKQKQMLVELALSSIQMYRKIFKKHVNSVKKLLDIILSIMVSIPEQIPQLWYEPPDGYTSQDQQNLDGQDKGSAIVKKMMVCIDLLATTLGYKFFIKLLGNYMITKYQEHSNDWRWKSAILMAASQLGQDKDLCLFDPFIKIAVLASNDQNPKVRYASAQLIGQIADDMGPQFQNEYFEPIFQLIIKKLDDPVQRVASHWCACMTNFLQDWNNPTQIFPYTGVLIEKICFFISNGKIYSKQNAVSALSSLGTIVSIFDAQTIKRPFEICNYALSAFSQNTSCRQFINQVIQCVSMIASSQPYPLTQNYINPILQVMRKKVDFIDQEYLLSAWNRLCCMKKKFQNWSQLYTLIEQKIYHIFDNYDVQQLKLCECALACIQKTAVCFQQEFFLFAPQTLTKLTSFLDAHLFQEKMTSNIFEAIAAVANQAKPANSNQNWSNTIKNLIIYLYGKIQHLQSSQQFKQLPQIYGYYLQILKNHAYILTVEQINQLFNKFIQSSANLTIKRDKLTSQIDINNLNDLENQDQQPSMAGQQFNDQVGDDLKLELVEQINQCKLMIPDVIESLLVTISSNNEQCRKLIQPLQAHSYQIICQSKNLLLSPVSHNQIVKKNILQDIKFGIYIIDNLIEDFDFQMLANSWENYSEVLKEYSLFEGSLIRNSAIFGLGLIVEKTPLHLVDTQLLKHWVSIFQQGYCIQKNKNQTKAQYLYCQDNFIAGVGKILKRYGDYFPAQLQYLYEGWVHQLPLKKDKIQNFIQIQFLGEIIKTKPEKIIQNPENIIQIVRVYTKVVKNCTKNLHNQKNRQMLRKIKQVIQIMGQWDIFKNNYQLIISSLSVADRFSLDTLVSSDSYTYI